MNEKKFNKKNWLKKRRMARELNTINSNTDTLSLTHNYNKMFYEVTPSVISFGSDNLKSPSKFKNFK